MVTATEPLPPGLTTVVFGPLQEET
jgi:hypothetical protein